MRRTLIIGFFLAAGLWTLAYAGGNNPGAKVAVHVLDHSTRSCTKNFPVIEGCQDIVTTNAGTNVDFFPVFFDLTEYTGVEYGLTWEGSTCAFTSCSDLVIGSIVNPGDAISHTWFDCHSDPVCIPGFGWIYSYGTICVVPHAQMGGPNVSDCQDPKQLNVTVGSACAGTNGQEGDDPCGQVATEQTTWSAIKGMFR